MTLIDSSFIQPVCFGTGFSDSTKACQNCLLMLECKSKTEESELEQELSKEYACYKCYEEGYFECANCKVKDSCKASTPTPLPTKATGENDTPLTTMVPDSITDIPLPTMTTNSINDSKKPEKEPEKPPIFGITGRLIDLD